MLAALNSQNEVIFANIGIENTKDFKCRYCERKLILKRGSIRVAHFAHKEKCQCSYNEYIKSKCGKNSELHYFWKLHIKEQMEKLDYVDRVDLEVKIGNSIADIVVYLNDKDNKFYREEKKFIIEVQLNKINLQTIINNSYNYINNGYTKGSIYWLMGEKNKNLAFKIGSCVLGDDLKIYSSGVCGRNEGEVLYDVVYLDGEDSCDMFQESNSSFYGVEEYREILELLNRLKLCRKLLSDIVNNNLDISLIANTVSNGKTLRKRYNDLKDRLSIHKNTSFTYNTIKHEIIKTSEELKQTIGKYKCLKNKYIKSHNTNSETINYIAEQVLKIKSYYKQIEIQTIIHTTKYEDILEWYYWGEDYYMEYKKITDNIYMFAKKIYEIEGGEVCNYIE